MSSSPISTSGTEQTINRKSETQENANKPPYEAPLHYQDGEHRTVIPGEYIVTLRPDHTLAKHSTIVGTDMEQYITSILSAITDHVVYICAKVNNKLLTRIRQDTGVKEVFYNFRRPIKLE